MFVKDNHQKPAETYDPLRSVNVFTQFYEFGFDREEHLKSLGATVNTDGSSNHLPDYYCYQRSIKKNFYFYTFVYLLWSVAVGIFSAVVVRYTMHGMIDSSGATFDIMNGWLVLYYNVAISTYVMMAIDTRNYSPLTVFLYIVTFGMLFLVAFMTDVSGDFFYGQVQFTLVLKTGLFWLCLLPLVIIAISPRLIERHLEVLVKRPEFAMIKD